MRVAESGLQATGQRLVDQDGVEMHGRLGNADGMALGRDAGMEIAQRLGVGEPFGFGRKTLNELK